MSDTIKVDIKKKTKAELEKEIAQKRWSEHIKKQKQKAIKLTLMVVIVGLSGGGLYKYLQPVVPEKSEQTKKDEHAQWVKDHQEEVLAQRKQWDKKEDLDPLAPKTIKTKIIPSKSTSIKTPEPVAPSEGQVASNTLPSKEMLENVKKNNGGKNVLAVGADGYALLPDGRKVKVTPAPVKSDEKSKALQELQKAKKTADQSVSEIAQFKSMQREKDKNGNEKPLTIDEILKARSASK